MIETNNQLQSIVERIERLQEERKSLGDDIKEVFAEAKGNGFDPAAIRVVLKDRAIERDEEKKRKAAELEAVADVYRKQLGLFD